MKLKNRAKGLTLIEMMMACFLFLLCTGVLASTFSRAVKTYFQGNERLKIQHNYRTALDLMSSEMRGCIGTPTINAGTIRFQRIDARKNKAYGPPPPAQYATPIAVEYVFDVARKTIVRNDYDPGNTNLSQTVICTDVYDVAYGWTAPSGGNPGIIYVTLTARNPTTAQPTTVYKTAASLRAGNELLGVQGSATGEKEPRETATFFKASP